MQERAFVNRVVDKIQTTVTIFSHFCECLVFCKQHGFKNRKKIIKLIIVYQALAREEIIKQKLAR